MPRLVHLKPEERPTWSPNGEEGWTVGPSLDHYRCIRCYFPLTRSERNCDTVTFYPNVIPFPKITTDNFLRQAASDIVSILSNPPSAITPTLAAGDTMRSSLLQLAEILQRCDPVLEPVSVASAPRVGVNNLKILSN